MQFVDLKDEQRLTVTKKLIEILKTAVHYESSTKWQNVTFSWWKSLCEICNYLNLSFKEHFFIIITVGHCLCLYLLAFQLIKKNLELW